MACGALLVAAGAYFYRQALLDQGREEGRAEVRLAWQQAETARAEVQAQRDATLRDWAYNLAKLAAGTADERRGYYEKLATGVADAIAKNPALRLVCLDPDSLRDFNAVGPRRPDREPTPGRGDAPVPAQPAPTPARSAGRVGVARSDGELAD